MNKQGLKLAALLCCVVLGLLYFVEWVTKATKPAATKAITTQITNAVTAAGTNMTPAVRAGIQVALEHIRDEIAHTTNTNDLETLRNIEANLTNVLARP